MISTSLKIRFVKWICSIDVIWAVILLSILVPTILNVFGTPHFPNDLRSRAQLLFMASGCAVAILLISYCLRKWARRIVPSLRDATGAVPGIPESDIEYLQPYELRTNLGYFIFCIFFSCGWIINLNSYLDHSPAKRYVLPITDTHCTATSYGSRYRRDNTAYAVTDSGQKKSVPITHENCKMAVPGEDTVIFYERQGALGLTWMSRYGHIQKPECITPDCNGAF